jgi:hypothetical protein
MSETQILLPNQKIEELFITIDLNLPQDSNELSRIEETISKLKVRIETIIEKKLITDDIHEDTYEEVVIALDKVGKLSEPAFAVEEQIETMYTLKYPHNPAFAKLIWYAHYEEVQHKYSLLKNRCFRMLDELDMAYDDKYGKNPPNWEI